MRNHLKDVAAALTCIALMEGCSGGQNVMPMAPQGSNAAIASVSDAQNLHTDAKAAPNTCPTGLQCNTVDNATAAAYRYEAAGLYLAQSTYAQAVTVRTGSIEIVASNIRTASNCAVQGCLLVATSAQPTTASFSAYIVESNVRGSTGYASVLATHVTVPNGTYYLMVAQPVTLYAFK